MGPKKLLGKNPAGGQANELQSAITVVEKEPDALKKK